MILDTPKIEELFLSLGYTKEDYLKIINAYPINMLYEETLIKNVRNNYSYLVQIYSKKEVIKMTKTLPLMYGFSIENLKKKIENMMQLGYSKEEVIKMTKTYPAIYSYSIENIKQKIEDMMSLNYTKDEIIKMTKIVPQIYGRSIENIEKKINVIMTLGYSKEEVIKMTKTYPAIYCYSIENIRKKIEDIMTLGYSKEEVLQMTNTLPSIFGYSIENMEQKIIDITKLGYTKKEVIKMTKTLPPIFGYSKENISQKIEFYDSINMHELAVEKSKYLMQSVNLSYARYEYLKENGKTITMNNYSLLFMNNKLFEKQYGITKKELLERYNYQEYINKTTNEKKLINNIKGV